MMPGARKTFIILRLLLGACSLQLTACDTIDLYEKVVSIPKHDWQSNFKPQFKFTIKDTNSNYQMYVILRHNEKYNYNNIYVNVSVKGPGQDTAQKIQENLVLATNEKGWLASGMDDIYDHRIQLGPEQSLKAGKYNFVIEQIMRENPLNNVLNVGLRIEKKQ